MIGALAQVLPADVMTLTLVFSRVGTMVMVLPALGEATVPPRARLALALALTLVMAPVVGSTYPAAAANNVGMVAGLVISEIVIACRRLIATCFGSRCGTDRHATGSRSR
jgi:flagellar biosynthetic protein FliR